MLTMSERNGRPPPNLDRTQPTRIRDQASVLAAMLEGADDDRITPELFDVPAYAAIARAIFDLRAEGEAVNPATVVKWLELLGLMGAVTDAGVVYQVANEPCHPEAIAVHVDSVIEDYKRRRLQDRAARLAQAALDKSQSVEELLAEFNAVDLGTSTKPRLKFLSSAELAKADFDVRWVIDWLLVEGQPCLMAGPKKSLKTNILIDLGISMSTAGWFLGFDGGFDRFKVNRPYRVGILSGESGGGTIQETARRICRTKGIELGDSGVFWCMDLPSFGDPASEREIVRAIEQHKLQAIIFDPAYLMLDLGDDAGNLFKVGAQLKVLTRLQQRTGATPILAHHFKRRENQYDPPELEHIAWAGFQEWARQWLLLGRREAYDPQQPGEHRLWLSAGGSAGHSCLWGVDVSEGVPSDPGGRRWDVAVIPAAEAWTASAAAEDHAKEERKEAKVTAQTEKDAAKLLAIIAKFPDGETERVIRERAGLSGTRAGKAITHLEETGSIEPCDVVKGKRTYPGFKPTGQVGTSGTERDQSR